MMPSARWSPVRPDRARALTDARLHLHHAAQLATALGISYLPPRGDDSHTNLEWLPDLGALASNPVPVGRSAVRVGVRVADFTILILSDTSAVTDSYPLDGHSPEEAAAWTREGLRLAGLDPSRYTLKRHYEIPSHAVATGASFRKSGDALEQLHRWLGNAAALFEELRATNPQASEVRCWPHHFDLATLITVAPGKTVGVGLEPGDGYYDEPYFYVNLHPSPGSDPLPNTIAGGGRWHTHQWIGAVLPGSRLSSDQAAQSEQATAFLESAIKICTELVSSS